MIRFAWDSAKFLWKHRKAVIDGAVMGAGAALLVASWKPDVALTPEERGEMLAWLKFGQELAERKPEAQS